MDASIFELRHDYFRAQLLGLLFDITRVYDLICQSGHKLPNDENKIRDEFGKYFDDQDYKETTTTAKNYYYDSEVRLPKTAGRVDMRFLSSNLFLYQDAFFAIECKRIDDKGYLCKEYVDNGIRRFTTGKYPSLLGYNAMLGFMVCPIDLSTTINRVNGHLNLSEYLDTISTSMNNVALESHHSIPRAFVLYHLWMDFSTMIIHY